MNQFQHQWRCYVEEENIEGLPNKEARKDENERSVARYEKVMERDSDAQELHTLQVPSEPGTGRTSLAFGLASFQLRLFAYRGLSRSYVAR